MTRTTFKWKDMSRTRGGRVTQWGFRMFYVGFAGIFIGGLALGTIRPSDPVVWAVMGAIFALTLSGLGITIIGSRIDDRALAEYRREVKAGERPPWKPGDPDPLG